MNDYNEKVIKDALTLLRDEEDKEILKEMEEASKIPEFQVKKGEAERFVKQFEKTRSRRAWLRVASIILVAAVSLTVVTLSVDGFREKFTSFFTNFTSEKYATVDVGESDEMFSEYQGQFVPTAIPEGYEVENIVNGEDNSSLILANKNGNLIVLREMSSDLKSNIDTENADSVEEIEINGFKSLLVEKDGLESIYIKLDETMLYIFDDDPDVDLIGFTELIEKR